MASLTDKARSLYLVALILFLIVIGFFMFDYFQIIDADEIFPFLKKKPALVNHDLESPSEIEKLEFQKAQERLAEEKEEIEKLKKAVLADKEKLNSELERLEQLRQGIDIKEKELQEKSRQSNTRQKKVKEMAVKVAKMPPESAVGMMKNWVDEDIIDVFKQMDKDAEEDGRQTITTYLLTLFPDERRAIITSKWLENDQALPEANAEINY